MSTHLLIVVTVIYLYVTCEFAWNADYNMAIVYGGYTLANIGLVKMAAKLQGIL